VTRVAVIDCGTNSTRLLVADDDGRTLRREMRITRLGEGVDTTGRLAEGALARNYDCLAWFRTIMDEHDVDTAVLVATSAARDAANGAAFLAEAGRVTGATPLLLTGVQEATFSFEGATEGLAPDARPTMIIDIGGGSTELAVAVPGGVAAYSMQLGCVRVSERCFTDALVTPADGERALAMIADQLDRALDHEPRLIPPVGGVRLVGLAGTVSTLAQLDVGSPTYQRDVVHHHLLTLDAVRTWRDRLGAETPAMRLARPGMVAGREDVLVGGLYVLAAVMERLGCDELLASENDILDGVAAALRRGAREVGS
jgi:exopolyphosphatase / guanosine-5'-triphosphate,3'-diphosphate pyrophosphatase